MAQLVNNPPAVWETWIQSLGWEDPLEKGKASYPLQCSGLENSMDCIVHGVAKSRTRLSLTHSERLISTSVTPAVMGCNSHRYLPQRCSFRQFLKRFLSGNSFSIALMSNSLTCWQKENVQWESDVNQESSPLRSGCCIFFYKPDSPPWLVLGLSCPFISVR